MEEKINVLNVEKQAQLRLCKLGPGTVLCPHYNLPLRFALVVFA